MTTTVRVSAHCATTKYVAVEVLKDGAPGEDSTVRQVNNLQDGEVVEVVVYDDLYVRVREIEKVGQPATS